MPENIDKNIERLRKYLDGQDTLGIDLVDDLHALIKAYTDIAESNDLYYKAADRARALWKESHGSDSRWSPGAPHLMVWMGEKLAAQKAEIDEIEIALQHRDNSIEGLEAEIERLKHQWATRETQRLYNKREHNLSQDKLYASLAAADALRTLVSGIVCRKGPEGGNLVYQKLDAPLCDELRKLVAAYTATRPQEDQSVGGLRTFTLTVTATPEQRVYVEGIQKWLQDSLDNKDMIVGGATDTARTGAIELTDAQKAELRSLRDWQDASAKSNYLLTDHPQQGE